MSLCHVRKKKKKLVFTQNASIVKGQEAVGFVMVMATLLDLTRTMTAHHAMEKVFANIVMGKDMFK